MSRRFLGIAAAAVLLSGVLTGTSLAQKEPYSVGAVFGVTGGASFLGEPQKNTVKMIEEWVNAAGGVQGHPLRSPPPGRGEGRRRSCPNNEAAWPVSGGRRPDRPGCQRRPGGNTRPWRSEECSCSA